jgi:integrase
MIRKPDPKTGMRQVHVYDPARRQKVYVGSRKNLRGPDGAQELERQKKTEFSGKPADTEGMTCNDYADRWLTVKHGPGTRRPSPTTEQVNRGLLNRFRTDFGDRLLDDGITRIEALDWSKQHPTNAKAVSAMFNDAVDDMLTKANPFANRRQTGSRGRRDIAPLTEQEVERLAELAYVAHGDYGDVCSAWILFLAWVGCRPSEMCQARWEHIGRDGRLTIKRVKGHKQTETIVLPDRAREPSSRSALQLRMAVRDITGPPHGPRKPWLLLASLSGLRSWLS